LAERKSVTCADLLAGLPAKEPWIVPLCGTRHVDRLDEKLGAVAVSLAPDEFAETNDLFAGFEFQRAGYPREMLQCSGL
jgi:aryl-alcohol dehydrogenase-like predicted oxidoreductase